MRQEPGPSSPSKRSGNAWTKVNNQVEKLKSINRKLKSSNQYYKKLSNEQYRDIRDLNSKLLAVDIPEDRPMELDPIHTPRPYHDDDIKAFVRSVSKGYGATDEQLSSL